MTTDIRAFNRKLSTDRGRVSFPSRSLLIGEKKSRRFSRLLSLELSKYHSMLHLYLCSIVVRQMLCCYLESLQMASNWIQIDVIRVQNEHEMAQCSISECSPLLSLHLARLLYTIKLNETKRKETANERWKKLYFRSIGFHFIFQKYFSTWFAFESRFVLISDPNIVPFNWVFGQWIPWAHIVYWNVSLTLAISLACILIRDFSFILLTFDLLLPLTLSNGKWHQCNSIDFPIKVASAQKNIGCGESASRVRRNSTHCRSCLRTNSPSPATGHPVPIDSMTMVFIISRCIPQPNWFIFCFLLTYFHPELELEKRKLSKTQKNDDCSSAVPTGADLISAPDSYLDCVKFS